MLYNEVPNHNVNIKGKKCRNHVFRQSSNTMSSELILKSPENEAENGLFHRGRKLLRTWRTVLIQHCFLYNPGNCRSVSVACRSPTPNSKEPHQATIPGFFVVEAMRLKLVQKQCKATV